MLSMGSFSFYLMNFLIKQLKGNMTYNAMAAQASDFTSCMGCFVLYKNLKMKNAFLLAYSVVIFGMSLLLIFKDYDSIVLMPFVVFIAKVGIASGFVMSMMAVITLMPTILSSTIFGCCSVLARMVTMAAPIVAEQPQPLPLIFGICAALIAMFGSRLLDVNKPDFI